MTPILRWRSNMLLSFVSARAPASESGGSVEVAYNRHGTSPCLGPRVRAYAVATDDRLG